MNSNMNDSMPLKVLRNLNCGTCNVQFFIKDFTLRGSRCPMLLNCGHSVCESCINQNLKATKVITCQVCSSKTMPQSVEQTTECFPISMYLVGSLVFQNSRNGKDRKFKAFFTERNGNFNYAVKQQAKLNSTEELSSSACEECSMRALWYCENCKSNLCEVCWCRIHGSARSLMRHCKTAISNVETSRIGWRKCPKHDSQDLEFYCKGCSTVVCSHCIILQHQGEGHCPITLKEKNIEIISNVKVAAEEAEKIRIRMKHTLEKIKLTESSSDAPGASFSNAERQITRNFSRMHGVLQLEEERLLGELCAYLNDRENRFRILRLKLEKQIEDVENLLRQYERAMRTPLEGDLIDLNARLEEVQNLPCYLISQKSGNEEAKLAFDERLIDSLKTYCRMDLPRSEVFELRSGSNLPEGYAVEALDATDSEAKPEGESGASDADTLSSPSSRDSAGAEVESSSARSSKEPVVFQERKNYSVRVSYIRNPGEFYVTLNSQRSRQQAIDRRASHVAASSHEIPQEVKKDEIYLVKYKVDKKWYRARVVEVFSPRRAGDEECMLVYYLDYGNSERVPVSRLRPLPADMLDPPLAVRCKLFDCVPKEGEWCVESSKTMEKILNNCTATMFVMKVHRHWLEVDLSVIYPDGQIGRDIVSVRDALLFLEFSSFVHGPKIPRNATALKYLQQCLPSAGETLDVVVTHVNSPSDFYVQNTKEGASYLSKLTADLQKYYCENFQKGVVYNPAVGMTCAALFPADRRWYRAKIVDIPGKKMVTVFYVDYGNKETIPWTEIRKLKESFVRWPPLALNCALAGIEPAGDFWSEQASSHVKKCLMAEGFLIQVREWSKPKPKLKVLLRKRGNATEVCVNDLLVDVGCAVRSGSKSLWKLKDAEQKATTIENFIPKNPEQCRKQPCGDEDEDRICSVGERNARGRKDIFTGRKRCKLSAKKLRELHESEKRNSGETSHADVGGLDVVDHDSIFKVKVEILSADSPSSIYVTFPALMEEFEHMQTKLNEFYQNSAATATDWEAGSACAVFDSSKNSWFRTSVLCTLPDGRVQVFLKDVARVSTVPASALRELDPSFKKYATGAVKCHLADVGPPGNEWPSISSEFLASELEQFKEVYMTKRGQIDNKSLPIELWVQKVVPSGALEPSAKEWITLNRLLVNQGLAVPLKRKDRSSRATPADDKECEREAKDRDGTRTARDEGPSDAEKDAESVDASDVFVPSLSSRWPRPEPLRRTRFVGMPTYVDFNAHVHMYDTEQDQNQLKIIRDALVKEYDNSIPSSEDHFWSPGQLCIARYHADNCWYRGVIMQVNEDLSYDVLFVDYGNVETCRVPDLRKGIKMHDIPVLSRKFQVYGIAPASEDGKWPVAIIDRLHSLVVDKECEVIVLKPSLDPGGPHVVSLKVIECDVDVGDFLVSRDMASCICSTSDVSGTSDADVLVPPSSDVYPPVSSKVGVDSGIPRRYVPLDVPDDGSGFFIQVTTVESEREFFANITDHESISSNLKTILSEFENLQKRLTYESHLQPVLEKLTKGQPCCCVNMRNNQWCRGEVQSSVERDDSVCIFYVDHGEREFLNKDLLHECKSEWLNIPKMAVKFRLADVEKCPDVAKSVYIRALTNCLYRSPLFAEVLRKQEDVFEVRLLTKKSGPLAYQEMIDEKLITVIA